MSQYRHGAFDHVGGEDGQMIRAGLRRGEKANATLFLTAASLAAPVPGLAATRVGASAIRGAKGVDRFLQKGYDAFRTGMVRWSNRAKPKGKGWSATTRRWNRNVAAMGYGVFSTGSRSKLGKAATLGMNAGSWKGFLGIEAAYAAAFTAGDQLWSEYKNDRYRLRTGRHYGRRTGGL